MLAGQVRREMAVTAAMERGLRLPRPVHYVCKDLKTQINAIEKIGK